MVGEDVRCLTSYHPSPHSRCPWAVRRFTRRAASTSSASAVRLSVHVFSRALAGWIVHLNVEPFETVLSVKRQFQERVGLCAGAQRLVFSGGELRDDATVAECCLREGSVLHLALRLRTRMHIFVKTLFGKTIVLDCTPDDTLREVKVRVGRREGIDADCQRLFLAGMELDVDDDALRDCGVVKGSVLHLELRAARNVVQLLFSDEIDGGGPFLDVDRGHLVFCVFEHYAELRDVPLCCLQFHYHGVEIPVDCDCTMEHIGVYGEYLDTKQVKIDVTINEGLRARCCTSEHRGPQLCMRHPSDEEAEPGGDAHTSGRPITFRVKDQAGEETEFRIESRKRMAQVFAAYARRKGVDLGSIRFLLDGQRIGDDQTPEMLNISDGDPIECVRTPPGKTGTPRSDVFHQEALHFSDSYETAASLSVTMNANLPRGYWSGRESFRIDKAMMLRRVFVSFASELGKPVDFFAFRYMGEVLPWCTAATPESLGMEEGSATVVIELSDRRKVPDGILIVLRHDRNLKPSYVNLDSQLHLKVDEMTQDILQTGHLISALRGCLQYTCRGKIISNDFKGTVAESMICDCDTISLTVILPKGDILISLEATKGTSDKFLPLKIPVNLDTSVNDILKEYADLIQLPPDCLESISDITFRGMDINCEDTVGQLGMKYYDSIIIDPAQFKGIIIHVENEHGLEQAFRIIPTYCIHRVFEAYSRETTSLLESLLFTLRGTEVSIDSAATVESLGLKDGDKIHVANITSGQNLTENGIDIMYRKENGSVDNPSFRPIVQVIDLLEAKHCNHWKFVLSDGTHYFQGECAPRLNVLFSNIDVGAIIQVEGFLIRAGVFRKKTCYLFKAKHLASKEIMPGARTIHKEVLDTPSFCHCCKIVCTDLMSCSRCCFAWYCSKDCQKNHWSVHKLDCRIYKEYGSFAKCKKTGMTVAHILDFWKGIEKSKPLHRNAVARFSNYLLHLSFVTRQELVCKRRLYAHILNAAFLRELISRRDSLIRTSLKLITAVHDGLDLDSFLSVQPHLKAGVQALEQSHLIDAYLNENNASDKNIVDSATVEGEVLVKFTNSNDEETATFYIELTCDVRQLLTSYAAKKGVPLTSLRFSYEGTPFSAHREIKPSNLGMKSRGSYMIEVLALSVEEIQAQECISQNVWKYHQTKKVRRIMARFVITKFILRCHLKFRAKKVITDFIWRHWQHQRAQIVVANLIWRCIALERHRRMMRSIIMIQKLHRGRYARRNLGLQLKEFRKFYCIWKEVINLAPAKGCGVTGWELVRESMDLKRVEMLDKDGSLADTDKRLNQALMTALEDQPEDPDNLDNEGKEFGNAVNNLQLNTDNLTLQVAAHKENLIDWSHFEITTHVVKFLRCGDVKWREIFVKKMKQLAKGERSHKLQKPLKGFRSVIYESYLENKSGCRILWTQEGTTIVVWFIAKHKSVTRLARLIDNAKHRTARQQLPDSFAAELSSVPKKEILLDALGNVPLKLYDVNFRTIDDIVKNSWVPQMHLTEEERKVVEAEGTILLLGRSGTGKTVCISNRIEFDRQRLGSTPNFSQLFVSRSAKLCRYVEMAVGSKNYSSFCKFDQLACSIESSLQLCKRLEQHVDFARFNQDFYEKRSPQLKGISALTVWRGIRTFLKGSIEAFQSFSGFMARDDFVSGKLGKKRCKLSTEMRDSIYTIFLQYQVWINDQHLWDDCDRVITLIRGVESVKKSDKAMYNERIKKSKIYVDEVQDYTQIEILFFFCIADGPGSLFLAGDPAQSVVEGSDFRFEDIRSVGYFVSGTKNRHLIPQKPKVVNINFRSHAGILKCAGGFLDMLFKCFPGSANQLPKDHGLFNGARPGVLPGVSIHHLSSLLKAQGGVVVLTHDESAAHWRNILDHPLVYGIREAKGLEFKSVIIVDFFAEVPLQKAFRNLLLNREGHDFKSQYPLIETHLKLMYTAVTRCIEQLFFAETRSSVAGDAAVRWLTSNTIRTEHNNEAIATLNNVSDIDGIMMSSDEFCIVGIDNANLAGSPDFDLNQASVALDRAIYCFNMAQNSELAAKAKIHKRSIQFRLRDKSHFNLKPSTNCSEVIEEEAAQLTELLLRENILSECTCLLNFVTQFLPSCRQEYLKQYVISRVQTTTIM